MRVQRYLSVVNARTKPELTFTEEREKASLWSLTSEKAWIRKSRDTSDESDSENTIGYIRWAGLPDVELWLSLSPERVLTISPKKEYRFHYERQWIGGK